MSFFMVEVMMAILYFSSLVFIVYVSYRERQGLLNRIMSRSYEEFTRYEEKPEPNDYSDGQEKLIPIEDARDEILEAE